MELKPAWIDKLYVRKKLLIVPYGIETHVELFFLLVCILLIVPYGIETLLLQIKFGCVSSFNRTLWN